MDACQAARTTQNYFRHLFPSVQTLKPGQVKGHFAGNHVEFSDDMELLTSRNTEQLVERILRQASSERSVIIFWEHEIGKRNKYLRKATARVQQKCLDFRQVVATPQIRVAVNWSRVGEDVKNFQIIFFNKS